MVNDEVDILLTGVTGFVGRYILHEILERHPEKRIAVIIRSSGKTSAAQRWANEIIGSTLFARWDELLRKVRVIDAALEHLETTTHQLQRATTLIHCAANIKHYDPYDALERDNVGNVERILKLAESLGSQQLILLSTCYVHPRTSDPTHEIVRITGSHKQSDFYNDYCYTKWRGEEVVYTVKTTIPNIMIARLSCVGAPVRWDLAAHPCPAQAHLGIVSLALRGFLEVLAWRQQARISVVPVDLVAKGIVDHLIAVAEPAVAKQAKQAVAKHVEVAPEVAAEVLPEVAKSAINLLQICPPPELSAYHLSLPLVVSILQTEFGLEDFRGLAREDSRGIHLAWWKQVFYSGLAQGKRALTLHTHVQDFVSTFTDTDLRFASSLDASLFPTLSEQDVIRETCAYAVRILHHRQLAKGVPLNRIDQFWHRVANREPVQVCIRLKEGVGSTEWPAFAQRFWTFMMQFRKCSAGISNASPIGTPLQLQQLSGHSLATYFSSPQPGGEESHILAHGLQQPVPDRLWHVIPFLAEDKVSHILFQFDHSLVDGVGAISHFPEFSRRVLEAPTTEPRGEFRSPRTLGLWMDLWMGLVYIALLAIMVWSAPSFVASERSKEPTIATASTGFVGPPSGRTYTTELLWKLTQQFTTLYRQPEHIFAVPTVTSAFRAAKDMPTNAFVPVLLPVDGRMSEEAFTHRCMLLRSHSVRFLSWCLLQLLEWGVWDEIRDLFLGKVRCVVSSLQAGSAFPTAVESMHIVTTTPTPIPWSVTVLTGVKKAHFTVRSHDPRVCAEKIMEILV
jgi:thioester reductase-like protein